MNTPDEIKNIVKEKYGKIADQKSGCCCGCSDTIEFTNFQDDYSAMKGYEADADLGLGCGVPTEFADIKKGDTVVDLGSGAGNDVFVVRSILGDTGKVIGIDMTKEMNDKANENLRKLGYKNVEFKLGEIEDLPLESESVDVVISNCVLNLVPDKNKAFSEIYRVLKNDAHFCISDVVVNGKLPEGLRAAAEMYAGCVSGALQQDEYLEIIKELGFKNIDIKKSKPINLEDELLAKYITKDEITEFRNSGTGIFSITVVGTK